MVVGNPKFDDDAGSRSGREGSAKRTSKTKFGPHVLRLLYHRIENRVGTRDIDGIFGIAKKSEMRNSLKLCKLGYFTTLVGISIKLTSPTEKLNKFSSPSIAYIYSEIAKICRMSGNFIKIMAFCLSQAIVIRGFRVISRPLLTAVKTSLNMGISEYSMPDQQARFAKAKAEGTSFKTL